MCLNEWNPGILGSFHVGLDVLLQSWSCCVPFDAARYPLCCSPRPCARCITPLSASVHTSVHTLRKPHDVILGVMLRHRCAHLTARIVWSIVYVLQHLCLCFRNLLRHMFVFFRRAWSLQSPACPRVLWLLLPCIITYATPCWWSGSRPRNCHTLMHPCLGCG